MAALEQMIEIFGIEEKEWRGEVREILWGEKEEIEQKS